MSSSTSRVLLLIQRLFKLFQAQKLPQELLPAHPVFALQLLSPILNLQEIELVGQHPFNCLTSWDSLPYLNFHSWDEPLEVKLQDNKQVSMIEVFHLLEPPILEMSFGNHLIPPVVVHPFSLVPTFLCRLVLSSH